MTVGNIGGAQAAPVNQRANVNTEPKLQKSVPASKPVDTYASLKPQAQERKAGMVEQDGGPVVAKPTITIVKERAAAVKAKEPKVSDANTKETPVATPVVTPVATPIVTDVVDLSDDVSVVSGSWFSFSGMQASLSGATASFLGTVGMIHADEIDPSLQVEQGIDSNATAAYTLGLSNLTTVGYVGLAVSALGLLYIGKGVVSKIVAWNANRKVAALVKEEVVLPAADPAPVVVVEDPLAAAVKEAAEAERVKAHGSLVGRVKLQLTQESRLISRIIASTSCFVRVIGRFFYEIFNILSLGLIRGCFDKGNSNVSEADVEARIAKIAEEKALKGSEKERGDEEAAVAAKIATEDASAEVNVAKGTVTEEAAASTEVAASTDATVTEEEAGAKQEAV